jgi:hypothetical protein
MAHPILLAVEDEVDGASELLAVGRRLSQLEPSARREGGNPEFLCRTSFSDKYAGCRRRCAHILLGELHLWLDGRVEGVAVEALCGEDEVIALERGEGEEDLEDDEDLDEDLPSELHVGDLRVAGSNPQWLDTRAQRRRTWRSSRLREVRYLGKK